MLITERTSVFGQTHPSHPRQQLVIGEGSLGDLSSDSGFAPVVLEETLRVPWTARKIKPVNLRGNQP